MTGRACPSWWSLIAFLFFVLCSYSSSPDLFCTYSAALSSRSISFPPSLGLADSGQGDYLPSAEIRHLRTRDLYLRPDIIMVKDGYLVGGVGVWPGLLKQKVAGSNPVAKIIYQMNDSKSNSMYLYDLT